MVRWWVKSREEGCSREKVRRDKERERGSWLHDWDGRIWIICQDPTFDYKTAMITIKFLITDEDAENGKGELGRRKGRKNTMRRKKQRSKKNVMAPAKRRQEEGARVKSCQRKDEEGLRFDKTNEEVDCFHLSHCCYCVKIMSLMISMVAWQEWMFNRTILLQNLLQLTGSVKSQNQSHVVILAKYPQLWMIWPVFFQWGWSDLDEFKMNVQLEIYSDEDVDHNQDDGWVCEVVDEDELMRALVWMMIDEE